jgi:transcriptional regulator with XRE-family HTH domain
MVTGETLRILRQLKGNKTQKEICSKLCITQPAYCKWEKRRTITDKELEKFLKAINCSREELETFQKFFPSPKTSNA